MGDFRDRVAFFGAVEAGDDDRAVALDEKKRVQAGLSQSRHENIAETLGARSVPS